MKELKIGEWYYMMLGYGGSGSQYVNIRRKTDKKTGEHMFSLFGGKGGEMRPLPVTDVFEAVAEDGVVHCVSANNLAANGHIGIGTLEEPKYGHVASICREEKSSRRLTPRTARRRSGNLRRRTAVSERRLLPSARSTTISRARRRTGRISPCETSGATSLRCLSTNSQA